MALPIYKMIVDENGEIQAIALTDAPAIGVNFIAFKDQKKKIYFNDDKRIIVSPLLIPNQLIYRYDNEIGEYYVTIDTEQIKLVAQKIIGKQIVFNFEHTTKTFDNVFLESVFVSDKDAGIENPHYFSDLPNNTLFIVAKVLNDEAWQMIKNKEVVGISIEGLFKLVQDDSTAEATPIAANSDIERLNNLIKLFEL
jgi:hypothetical protein